MLLYVTEIQRSELEPIANTMNGNDMFGARGIDLYFFAELENLVVDSSRLHRGAVPPDIFEEFLSRYFLSRPRDKIL